jgi:predicted RNase H-like nuclease (RuvC/YqgF family)
MTDPSVKHVPRSLQELKEAHERERLTEEILQCSNRLMMLTNYSQLLQEKNESLKEDLKNQEREVIHLEDKIANVADCF